MPALEKNNPRFSASIVAKKTTVYYFQKCSCLAHIWTHFPNVLLLLSSESWKLRTKMCSGETTEVPQYPLILVSRKQFPTSVLRKHREDHLWGLDKTAVWKGMFTSISLKNAAGRSQGKSVPWPGSLSRLIANTGSQETQESRLMGPMLANLRTGSRRGWIMHEAANARYPAHLLSSRIFFLITLHSLGTDHRHLLVPELF